MEKVQFRVLYRQFLFRMVDLEILSADALGDSNKLLGQFAALLIFLSIFFLSGPTLAVASSRLPPEMTVFGTWGVEHFLIATTMLVVGLFAVLSWDSTFPDRRDVLVLAPLPVRARTLFLAKVAAVGTALGLTVLLLHSAAGLVGPLALSSHPAGQVTMPAFGYLPARPPADAAGIEPLLKNDLPPELPRGMGLVVGIVKHGERRIVAYGTAHPDSIYQVGSITKTFTGLLLAQMALEGRVRLDEPLRAFLPSGTVANPGGSEITLLDLATHHSGLAPMPDDFNARRFPTVAAAFAGYHAADLRASIARHGVGREASPPFVYSNWGFSLLGEALSVRAGVSYPELIAQRITGPLHMRDTSVVLSPERRQRLIQAYGDRHEPLGPWELDSFAPAGAINSTAGDMLTYLEAQLRADSSAVRLSQVPRAAANRDARIALAWFHDGKTGTYGHSGAISGYGSYAFFNPKGDYAGIVLVNQASSFLGALLPLHVRQRLAGEPAISLALVTVPQNGGLSGMARMFAVYWAIMFLSGTFVYCCVLGLQGFAAQLLPRRLFLRVSSWLQMVAFCVIVCVYCLQPTVPPDPIHASGRGLLAWSPSYWFLGLFQQWNGTSALAVLAHRAWMGLGIALSATAIAYALSYFRTIRKIVEEPDIVGGAGSGMWLPRIGSLAEAALVQFSVRTLQRSRLHRIILAFYLGVGFALVIAMVKNGAPPNQLTDAPAADPWSQVNEPLLAATITMMGFAMIGTRVAFSIPLDLRGNWIFQVTGVRRVPECLAADRRSLLLLSAAPLWILSALCCFWLWPWRAAAGHLAILAAVALILAELCLHGFHKIPFTCSYLPGKSQVHLAILGGLALLWSIILSVMYERQALAEPKLFLPALIGFAVVWAGLRWRTAAHAGEEGAEVQFEELAAPAVQVLGLGRDGEWPTRLHRAEP
ncbi:serine hydrolase domain-containing protein [uncultured Paludibaculum sp.]|uniref:serine hydrolase domain-containing protein n=1 Tax=uncultured Paludibaculum sp. TaxID=1765020 RepID=UPI002AAB9693|nr:serine hydrolase domain-containing protein [uncultured Paludibaculum sp.]